VHTPRDPEPDGPGRQLDRHFPDAAGRCGSAPERRGQDPPEQGREIHARPSRRQGKRLLGLHARRDVGLHEEKAPPRRAAHVEAAVVPQPQRPEGGQAEVGQRPGFVRRKLGPHRIAASRLDVPELEGLRQDAGVPGFRDPFQGGQHLPVHDGDSQFPAGDKHLEDNGLAESRQQLPQAAAGLGPAAGEDNAAAHVLGGRLEDVGRSEPGRDRVVRRDAEHARRNGDAGIPEAGLRRGLVVGKGAGLRIGAGDHDPVGFEKGTHEGPQAALPAVGVRVIDDDVASGSQFSDAELDLLRIHDARLVTEGRQAPRDRRRAPAGG